MQTTFNSEFPAITVYMDLLEIYWHYHQYLHFYWHITDSKILTFIGTTTSTMPKHINLCNHKLTIHLPHAFATIQVGAVELR